MLVHAQFAKTLHYLGIGWQAATVYRGSVCTARRSPSGSGWALEHRHNRIRDKLRAQFCSVEDCFAALDEDNSGTLNRRELAVGLAKASK